MATVYTSVSILRTWTVVSFVLVVVLIIPLLVVWLVSLCRVRRRGDHARVGFLWLKIAFALYILAFLFHALNNIAYVLAISLNGYSSSTRFDLEELQIRVGWLGSMFYAIGGAVLLIVLAEVGNGFLYIRAQARTGLQKGLRWATLALGLVVTVLAISQMGLAQAVYSRYFANLRGNSTSSYQSSSYARDVKTLGALSGAIASLLLVGSIAVVAYAGLVVHKVKKVPNLKKSAVLFLVASILQLINAAWDLVDIAIWTLPDDPVAYPLALYAVSPILTDYTVFVALILLFVVGTRKNSGIWSNPQRWMNGAPATGGWASGPAYPQQPQQQYVYVVPRQQQGWTQQQPAQGYAQPLYYAPVANTGTNELAYGGHGEK